MNLSHPVIELTAVSKKFDRVWIFRNIDAKFEAGKKHAITGPNGSGKSTLLKIIAGIITPNQGKVNVTVSGAALNINDLFGYITFCAPYMELPEDLSLIELLNFHQQQRNLIIPQRQLTELLQLEPDKEIRHYSSGMKQRLKLALAFYTETSAIFLDEPTATLDRHWATWYHQLVARLAVDKLLIISSNEPAEYSFCDTVLDISLYTK